jgi:hypothetical protein
MKVIKVNFCAVGSAILLLAGLHASPALCASNASKLSFQVTDTSGKPVSNATVMVRASRSVCVTDERGSCGVIHPLLYADIDLTADGFVGLENKFAVADPQGRIVVVLRSIEEARLQAQKDLEEARLKAQRDAEEARRQTAIAQEAERAQLAENLKTAKEASTEAICTAMGSVLRGESKIAPAFLFPDMDAATISREFARRKLVVNRKLVVGELLALGIVGADRKLTRKTV